MSAAADGQAAPEGEDPFPALAKVTDPAEIHRLLAQFEQMESELDAKITTAVGEMFDAEPRMAALAAARSQLEVVGEDSKELLSSITLAANVAEKISGKVRELDLQQTRLQEVIDVVAKIADGKQAGEELGAALREAAFETAAGVVRKFRDATEPPALVEGLAQFASAVESRLSAAEEAADVQAIGRFAKLMAAMGAEKGAEGIRRLARYLRGVVERAAKAHRARLVEGEGKGEPQVHVRALSAILEVGAGVIQEQREGVLGEFGGGAYAVLLGELCAECDGQVRRVLRAHTEKHKLPQLCEGATRAAREAVVTRGDARGGGQEAVTLGGLTPPEIGTILDELALISERCEVFEAFVTAETQAATEAVAAAAEAEAEADGEKKAAAAAAASALAERGKAGGGLRGAVQETVGHYISLEAFLIEHNVRRAIEMDELPSERRHRVSNG